MLYFLDMYSRLAMNQLQWMELNEHCSNRTGAAEYRVFEHKKKKTKDQTMKKGVSRSPRKDYFGSDTAWAC